MTPIPLSPKRLAPLLWLLLAFFVLRVIGQLLVATLSIPWLPPMEEWYSGLIPYRPLVVAQVLIITLYTWVCIDFTRGVGFFARTRWAFGPPALLFGFVYFAAMVARYIIRMAMYPDERWLGGCIPIVFHWVLASFIIAFGLYHRAQFAKSRYS